MVPGHVLFGGKPHDFRPTEEELRKDPTYV